MMGFRDMTFCSSNCVQNKCSRHYGPDDEKAARKWWGPKGEPPIAMSDFSTTCPDYTPPDDPCDSWSGKDGRLY